jgi:hypothetical protein
MGDYGEGRYVMWRTRWSASAHRVMRLGVGGGVGWLAVACLPGDPAFNLIVTNRCGYAIEAMGELSGDSAHKWKRIQDGDSAAILQGQLDPGVIIVSTRTGSEQPVSQIRMEGDDLAAMVEHSGRQQSAAVVVEGADCPQPER